GAGRMTRDNPRFPDARLRVSRRRVGHRAEQKNRPLQAGFTLLEVLVALAILGLGLVVILSSQAGLFSSASRGEHLTVASNLLRCKMSEIELTLEQKGFSLTDENDEGGCCDDEGEGYTCSWKIERVELPPLPEASMDADGGAPGPAGSAGLSGPGGLGFGAPPPGPGAGPGAAAGGPLGALMGIAATQGASLGDKATPGSVMQQLGSTGTSGMEGMVMGFVYPSLKPMLEASIRRVTVKVKWNEGRLPRELEVTQFLTRPQEGQLGTADMLGLGALGGIADQLQGTTGTSTSTSTTGSVKK
ncbi:MAG: prepilin-type N-terminal cleavage/methylation domain-containing protein, partial [Myxococcales bacterium]